MPRQKRVIMIIGGLVLVGGGSHWRWKMQTWIWETQISLETASKFHDLIIRLAAFVTIALSLNPLLHVMLEYPLEATPLSLLSPLL